MKIAISVPTGFHARELLLPLKGYIEQDSQVEAVLCITPGAAYQAEIFPTYGPKFTFVATQADVATYTQLFQREQPDIVITTTSGLDPGDVPILAAARTAGIQTFTFVSSWDNVYKMERLKKFNKPYVLADHLAVWNQMMYDHLLRVFPELKAEQVSIVGAPRFDFFTHHQNIPTRAQLFQYLNLVDETKPLLHIATTELYPMEYIVKTIDTAMKASELPSLHLYASVHPGGNLAKHQGYAEKYNVTVRYSFGRRDSAPLPEFQYNPTLEEIYMLVALFKYTNVLVNHSSTVAIESFFCDVPVINVKYGQRFDWWQWRRSMVYRDFQQHYADITRGGATAIVNNPRQLVAQIQHALQEPADHKTARAATLTKLITYTDGTASQRLLNLIKHVATV